MTTPSTERAIKSAGKVNFTNYDRPSNFKAGNNHILRKLFPWLLEQRFSTGSNVALTLGDIWKYLDLYLVVITGR